jgi:hypothetical protein
MAVMSAAGVTSNAGLYTPASGGAVNTPNPRRTSSASRCSISIASPLGIAGSNVLHGAAT